MLLNLIKTVERIGMELDDEHKTGRGWGEILLQIHLVHNMSLK